MNEKLLVIKEHMTAILDRLDELTLSEAEQIDEKIRSYDGASFTNEQNYAVYLRDRLTTHEARLRFITEL